MTRTNRPLLAAILTPETALITAAAVVTAVAAQLPAVLLPAALACAACALLRARREPLAGLDPALQARVERCRAAYLQARELIEGLAPAERALLGDAAQELARLVATSGRLAAALDEHQRDLSASDERALSREHAALVAQRAVARDGEIRQTLDRALAQHEARVQARAALETRAGRLSAQLAAIEAALDAALAQLRRVRGVARSPSASELAELARALAQPASQAATVADAIDEAQRD